MCVNIYIHIYRDLGVVSVFLDSLHCFTSPHFLRWTGDPLTSWYPWGRGGSLLANDSSSRAVRVSKWKLFSMFDSLQPMDCSLPGSTVHGILQARILEWVAFPFCWGSSQPRLNASLPHCRQILYQLSHKGSPRILEWVAYPFSRGSSQPRNETSSPALQADSLPTELWGKPVGPCWLSTFNIAVYTYWVK